MRMARARRRIRVVNGRMQYGVIAVFLAVILAGLVVFSLLAALVSLLAGGSANASVFVSTVLPYLLLNDLCAMVLLIVAGVFATHRIAGPVFRIEEDIQRVLDGEPGVVVKFRRGDAFPGLAERVNELIAHLPRQRGS